MSRCDEDTPVPMLSGKILENLEKIKIYEQGQWFSVQ